MPVVIAGPGDSTENVIRKFSRKMLSENLLYDMHRKDYFVKKGMRRKIKAIAKRKRYG